MTADELERIASDAELRAGPREQREQQIERLSICICVSVWLREAADSSGAEVARRDE